MYGFTLASLIYYLFIYRHYYKLPNSRPDTFFFLLIKKIVGIHRKITLSQQILFKKIFLALEKRYILLVERNW